MSNSLNELAASLGGGLHSRSKYAEIYRFPNREKAHVFHLGAFADLSTRGSYYFRGGDQHLVRVAVPPQDTPKG